MPTSSELRRRPLLVWGLYILHWLLLVSAIVYAIAALGYLRLDDQTAAQIARQPKQDTWILLTSVVGCFVAIHFLFVRKQRVLPIYLLSVAVYILPNVARYVRACVTVACPNNQFLLGVGRNAAIFGVVVFLVVLALHSWPPKRPPRVVGAPKGL